ncbi:MAG: hypothetical protein PUB15_05850 [Ruminobacter sp.]|nr:hypothetical protein [Ruminobacter sp.]
MSSNLALNPGLNSFKDFFIDSVRAKVVCHFSATETCPNPNQNCYGELSQI